MQQKKILFLTADCDSSRWVFNALAKEFLFEAVIIEKPVAKKMLIKRRIKRIGFFKVVGQVFFSVAVVPVLKSRAKKRKAALIDTHKLDSTAISHQQTFYVRSVNDDASRQLLEKLQPDLIIVNGTRIISKKILECTPAVFINMHAGITPQYRGSHGGYWALRNNDSANFGTTIHLVDAGVDTGSVIKQVFTQPTAKDNFTTYPVLQTVIGIVAIKEVLQMALQSKLPVYQKEGTGQVYYQPTLWSYLINKTP